MTDTDPCALPEGMHRCPHCGLGIEIVAVNCGIFACGTTAAGQLPPHGPAPAARPGAPLLLGCGRQSELRGGRLHPCAGK